MTVARLGPDTVGGLAGADLPRYDRGDVTAGVVHVGLGAFGRAHVARYCEDLLDTGDPQRLTIFHSQVPIGDDALTTKVDAAQSSLRRA